MQMPDKKAIDDFLAEHSEWAFSNNAIERAFRMPTFHRAIALVVQAAMLADAADHHPDLDIRYNVVTVTLTTHSEGGVTQKDIDLASRIEAAAAS